MSDKGKDQDPWYKAGEQEEQAEQDYERAEQRLDEAKQRGDQQRLIDAEEERDKASERLEQVSQRNLKGCLPSVAVVVAILVLGTLAVGALRNRNEPAKKQPSGSVGGAGGGSEGGAAAAYAGRYVLTKGLNDPTGLDVHRFGGRPPGQVGSSSASITIASDGRVSAASISTSITQNGCTYTAEGSKPTGGVNEAGVGTIDFFPVHTEEGPKCQSRSESYGLLYNIAIEDDVLYACRANLSGTTCEGGEAPSRFTKQS